MRTKPWRLSVEIDSRLAADYRAAYSRAFGDKDVDDKPLAIFIAGFVEDRLCEEIEFALGEVPPNSE